MEFEVDSTYVSRQDINNFPFPHKLWLIVNSETCDFIKWDIDGTGIELKIVGLDGYLHGTKSIFKIKNRSTFIEHLRSYGFAGSECLYSLPKKIEKENVNVAPTYSELIMKFKHENFLRHRIDLLAKIRRIIDLCVPSMDAEKMAPKRMSRSMDNNLPFMSYGALSQIQKSRIKYKTILHLQTERAILNEKLLASELRSRAKGILEDEEDTMIELPAELFENPHDSVLFMGEEHQTAYAGYYGSCDKEEIIKFFGDYLPMYENTNDHEEGERKIIELNPAARQPSEQPINIELNYSLDMNALIEETVNQPPPLPPMPSSSLQPIFTPDKYVDEEDISMDDFLTFKEQTNESELVQSTIKIEEPNKEEDNENETNFKNFFSQYRESLSLLYERQ